jgi:hypothetical protein
MEFSGAGGDWNEAFRQRLAFSQTEIAMTTTARMTRFSSRLASRRSTSVSDIVAILAFAAAVAFSGAIVLGLFG